MKLKDRVALVTGASRGIGRALALKFAEEGADVVVNYLNSEKEAWDVVREAARYGVAAIPVKADVSKSRQVRNLVDTSIDEFGRIDILANNAGIYERINFFETAKDVWDRTMDTNLGGPFLCSQYAGMHMMERQYGKILNIASAAGINAQPGRGLEYGASKSGLVNFTKSLALTLAPYVNVNCIAPGYTMTDMTAVHTPEYIENARKSIPLRRLNKPEDIANLALFLVSEDSRNITGQTILVDGGRNLQSNNF